MASVLIVGLVVHGESSPECGIYCGIRLNRQPLDLHPDRSEMRRSGMGVRRVASSAFRPSAAKGWSHPALLQFTVQPSIPWSSSRHDPFARLLAFAVALGASDDGVRPDAQYRKGEGHPQLRLERLDWPGFGLPDAQGNWTGFDVEFCRALAAAIFNDPSKVKFAPLTAKDRFTTLQAGEVDVLSRNTTWTSTRDTANGLNFTGITYYDGQAFMVRKSMKINSALELTEAAVCVQQGTTTELNLADYFRGNRMKLKTVTFASADELIKAYDTGRCDAFTTDGSGLYRRKAAAGEPQ